MLPSYNVHNLSVALPQPQSSSHDFVSSRSLSAKSKQSRPRPFTAPLNYTSTTSNTSFAKSSASKKSSRPFSCVPSRSLKERSSSTTLQKKKWRSPSIELQTWLAEQLTARHAGSEPTCPVRRSIFRALALKIGSHLPSTGLEELLMLSLNELQASSIDHDEVVNEVSLLKEKDGEIEFLKTKLHDLNCENSIQMASVGCQTCDPD
ncbi:hypothetical protein GEMRC1_004856 [Eukaryota sp. GEM-RC1]